jgi:hypothetical protein
MSVKQPEVGTDLLELGWNRSTGMNLKQQQERREKVLKTAWKRIAV